MAEKCLVLDTGIHANAELHVDNFRSASYSSSESSSSLDETQEGYDYEVVPSVDKKYECPVCLMLLRNPVQTPCGHRFCKACLKRWIRESEDPRCPYDNERLVELQIFPDNFAKREILALTVKCPNSKYECPLICELRQMELHVDICEYRMIPCPQQCGQNLVHSHLVSHLKNECTKRRIQCQHCNATTAYDEVKDHLLQCPLVAVECDHCSQQLLRHQMSHHLNYECSKVTVTCSFHPLGCHVELTREDLESHYHDHIRQHLQLVCSSLTSLKNSLSQHSRASLDSDPSMQARSLPQSHAVMKSVNNIEGDVCCQATGLSRSDRLASGSEKLMEIPKMLNDLSADHGISVTTPTDSCFYDSSNSEFSRLHQRNFNLEEKAVQQQQLILELQAKNSSMEKRVYDQESRIKEMREQITDFEARNCRGVYIWKIPKYSYLRKQAMKGEASVLHSPGFYTDMYGYKMCIRINLNGVDTAQDTHLSIFIHFMQGEYDDLLEWPFKGKINLSILDQSEYVENRRHITETLLSKPTLAAFQRPRSFRNHKGFGYVEFVPFAAISENSAFLKNDTLAIKAVVSV